MKSCGLRRGGSRILSCNIEDGIFFVIDSGKAWLLSVQLGEVHLILVIDESVSSLIVISVGLSPLVWITLSCRSYSRRINSVIDLAWLCPLWLVTLLWNSFE